MKSCWISLLSWLFVAVSPLAAQEWTLADAGKTDYRIVTAENPPDVVQNAAAELRQTLGQMTGVDFPQVVENAELADGKYLLVGASELAKKLFPDVDWENFKYDEILIRSDEQGNILFAGHARRGVLYAVVTFLEDTLGCRWWTSTESTIPQIPTLKIPPQNHRYAPALIYRESYYRDAFEEKMAVRSKCNGNMARISAQWGGHHRFLFFVHSFYHLIPPVKYFKEHPDWFPEIDGVRKVGHPSWAHRSPELEAFLKSLPPEQVHESGTQLCLSNDAMREELTRNALEHLRKNPHVDFISISQNDWHGNCQCEKCKACDEKNGSPAGSLITFVNRVAEDIEKEFPHVWVETLAYQYTRKPPKEVRPRKNVVVRLCTIECSFLQPLEQGGPNQALKDDIEGWSQIAPQLFVWDYITNFSFYLLPHPNMRVLAPNIRFFVKNKTIGLFEQGDSFTTVGDFVAARNWVVSHLLWNPDQDEERLWEAFFQGYYGSAGPILREYLRVIHDAAEKKETYLRCFRQNTHDWMDLETLEKAVQLAQKAKKAVENDPVLARRVQTALFACDLNALLRYDEWKFSVKIQKRPFLGPENPGQEAQRLLAFAEEQGTHAHREGGTGKIWEEFKENLLTRFARKPAENPNLPLDWEKVLWLDFQDAVMGTYRLQDGYTQRVEDSLASDGKAIRMPGWHREWATSYTIPETVATAVAKWHVYAAVRWEATAQEGTAMTLGIYDYTNKKGVCSKTLKIEDFPDSGYQIIDLGSHALQKGMNVWFAPPERPDEVQNVFIDRIFLVEETE